MRQPNYYKYKSDCQAVWKKIYGGIGDGMDEVISDLLDLVTSQIRFVDTST